MGVELNKNNFKYYLYSILAVFFQFLYLAYLKDFDGFNKYIEVFSCSVIVIGLFGSVQFYFIKEKNQVIGLKIKKNFLVFFSAVVLISFFYYFFQKPEFGIFYLSSIVLSLILLFQGAVYANLNYTFFNTKFLLLISSIKFFLLIFFSFFLKNIFLILIYSNLILIIIWIIFYFKNILFEKEGYSIFSATNTMIGSSISSVDKIVVSNFYQNLSVNYYLIFRVSAILQILGEIIFRNERFQITSKILQLNYKIIFFKIFSLSFFIIVSSYLIKFSYLINTVLSIEFINEFFNIVSKYQFEYIVIAFSILINSISGLFYDYIYSFYGNKNLIFVNVLSFCLLIGLLLNFVNDLTSICLIFFSIQSITVILLIFLTLFVKKNERNVFTEKL